MKKKITAAILLVALFILLIANGTSFIKKKDATISLPSLPMPIAKEYALITSAGQNTDAYIINDIANKLMIHNFFMPQAKKEDLDSVNTIVFVVGYSNLGEKLHGMSYEDEKKRIVNLVSKANENKLIVITVFLGGKQQRNSRTEELLSIIAPESDYLIGTKAANEDGFLTDLAKNHRVPITIVNGVNDISEPFTSAFR